MVDDTLAIGCAAGFGGDRVDSAGPVVETLIARGGPGWLTLNWANTRNSHLHFYWVRQW